MSVTPVLRRTVVHIDSIRADRVMVCTVSGVDLPVASVCVPMATMPGTMQHEAAPGRVFFAYANLNATRSEDVGVERIERRWGVTDGPLHFEAPNALT